MRRWTLQGTALIVALLVIFSGTKSFSSQRAGFGTQTATGYQVSNVKYWLTSDSDVRSVNFDLDGPAHEVLARLESAGSWYRCSRSGATSWSCLVPQDPPLAMDDADAFQVRAY